MISLLVPTGPHQNSFESAIFKANGREELEKAKRNVKDHPEDVMNYLRTAIDLAIKERFGFKEIPRMIKFIEQAEKAGFPLPSYDLI